MKRSIIIGLVCALLTVGVAWANQVWRDNTDGGNHSLGNVSTIQANNGIGSGTRCAQFDSAGNLQPNATACGAGLGGSAGVSSVTGTAQHISATPTTGAVVVDTIGGYSTGAVTGGNVSMGAFASGVDEQVTTAGQAAPFTYQCVAGEVQYGAASAGALAQSSSLTWDDSTHRLFVGAYINFLAAGAPGTPAVGHGDLYEDNVSANIAFKNGAGTVNHGIQTKACGGSQWVNAISDAGGAACVQPAFTDVTGSLACGQLPALGGDLISAGATCSVQVIAMEETGGHSRLSINAIPTGTILNRPSASATVVGTTLPSLLAASGVAYYTQQWAVVRNSSFGTLPILNNKQTVLAVANGLDQGFAVTAAGGTAIATTIAANFTNFPIYTPSFAGFAHASLSVNITNLSGAGSGTGTLVVELFAMNLGNPGTAANYTSLGAVSTSFTVGTSFYMGNTGTLSAIPGASGLVLVAYRSDSTGTLTVSNGIAFTATLVASNP